MEYAFCQVLASKLDTDFALMEVTDERFCQQ